MTNLFKITPSIGAVTTGNWGILIKIADAKCVVNNLRKEASDYQLENGHAIPISVLSMRLGDTH